MIRSVLSLGLCLSLPLALSAAENPTPASAAMQVVPVTAPHGMVVAAHPEVAQIGADVLRAGGNAMDAAVAVALALGVAEPYGSGLGGKLTFLYHDAKTGSTYAVDAMDQAGSNFTPEKSAALGDAGREGWPTVCVPGLAAGLYEGHRRWGSRPWAENVAPVIKLARDGYTILPKTRLLYNEQLTKLRKPFAKEAAAIYLAQGELPTVGSRQPNPDLAHTMELLAQHGRDGFYRGPVAEAIVQAAQRGGGWVTLEDFANFEVRVAEPLRAEVAGRTLLGVLPPSYGGAVIFAALEELEKDPLTSPLRTAAQIDRVGRLYLNILARARSQLGDTDEARTLARRVAAGGIRELPAGPVPTDSEGTTHFAVVDAAGNIVCATQSLSLHFGAGVVAPGTGVVMNNTMSNFSYRPGSANSAQAGRRPTSTVAPILVFEGGRPVLAIGLPGSTRIPSGLLQVLADHLLLQRRLADAIGDTRMQWVDVVGSRNNRFESENTLPASVQDALRQRGWEVDAKRVPGGGSHFGGVNAITLNPDGSRTGFADPRRTNAAVGH
jgi:gamma-glutamyltranspeptidase/glutathione hydrolase